ncbi:hypothetical protein [Sphingopyxis sp.]|uniref:hypothetical protein n=1 Tax=Sphingopyxis sp. TaxID=1908224 RepID=UPI0025DE39C6|nr:hypothetical protein [Sphingopyxis sp.]
MSAVQIFVDLLAGRRNPARLAPRDWDGVIGVARSEAMLATLAHRVEGPICHRRSPRCSPISAPRRQSRSNRRCGRPRWRGARLRPSGSSSCC